MCSYSQVLCPLGSGVYDSPVRPQAHTRTHMPWLLPRGQFSQDCRMQQPKHPRDSIKSPNIMDHNTSTPLLKSFKHLISFIDLLGKDWAFFFPSPPTPNTPILCQCHDASVVYCSRASFSIDFLDIAILHCLMRALSKRRDFNCKPGILLSRELTDGTSWWLLSE